MNKELILKYETEFNHWLKGGKILMHYGKWVPVALDAKWEFSMSDLEKIGSFGYVINDEYVEFRKALAEGKTIQLNEAEKFADSNRGWVDLSRISLGDSRNLFPVNYYRIKPEKFFYKVDILCQNGIEAQAIYQHSDRIIGKYNYVIVEYNGYNRIGRINTLVSEPKFSCKDILSCVNLKELKLE